MGDGLVGGPPCARPGAGDFRTPEQGFPGPLARWLARLLAFAVALAGLLAAASAAEPIRFGMEAVTGSFSADEENLGFRIAFREANAAGGIHGRQIEWVARERPPGLEQSVAYVRQLIEQDGVFGLINMGGPQAIPIAKLAQERRVPHLFPHTALVSSVGNRYLFTSFPGYSGEARLMFRYLPKERGLKRLGIVHDENVYGQLFLNHLREFADANGYTVVGNEPVNTRTPADLAAELGRLAAAGADGIVMALYPAQAKTLMAAKAKLGWKGRMISVGPLTDEAYLVLPDGVAEGTLGFCYYPDPNQSDAPGIARYRAAMERLEPGHALNRYSLYGYVFGRLIVEGLQRAGAGADRERFIDAMESIQGWDPQGVMPPVSFSRDNHHAQFAGFICELKDGKFTALSDWVTP